jgi:O-antigen/teichoic acid export membrane protein
VVKYSIPFLAIGLLNLITWRQSEVLFLGHFRGAEEAGFFDLAYRCPQMILEFVPGAIWPLVMAGFSEVYTRDRDALERTSIAYYKLLFFLVAPLSMGGLLVGDLAIRILYPDFGPSGIICQVFFVIFSISFFSAPLGMVLYVVERPWIALVIYVVNASVNVGLDLALIPRFGLWGAVIPVSLVIVFSPLPYLWALRRLGIRLRLPWGFLLRIYAASGSMLLLWPLRSRIGGPVTFLGLVALGVGVFVAGVRLFRVLGPEERSLIHRVNPPAWNWLEPILAGRGPKGDR